MTSVSDLLVYSGPGGGQATVIEIETKYTELCMEKTTLEAEQARLGRSVRTRASANRHSSRNRTVAMHASCF